MNYLELNTAFFRGNFTFSANLEITSRVTTIFGPSGSGKTSLLYLLSGLLRPGKGTIKINGQTIVDTHKQIYLPTHRRGAGYVFQEGRLFPHLDVKKNLKFGWKRNTHDQHYFDEIIELLELNDLLDYAPSKLSGGQKQRVAIGRALMSNAQILLLDEPFTGLDPVLKKQVISLLNKVIEYLNIPVIIVGHELQDLLMLTRNIILIKDGKAEKPNTYLELIRSKKLLEFNGLISNYYNIYEGRVLENIPHKGLTKVRIDSDHDIILLIENDDFLYTGNDRVKISLRGADVSLALHEVKEISIRNQLKGEVETLFQHRNHMVCIVNCGIKIITRLTIDSAKGLKLKVGKELWCLFKSLAIESYR
jgi:molybdate transport system ATP-binding protein